ncbi:MAG: YceI family protein [Candidatus Woesearchaeota archaeon]|nr:YceI family protein [Candidatus Woesearchaeota archaeon]
MKYIAFIMILALFVACTAPPEDVPRAQPAAPDTVQGTAVVEEPAAEPEAPPAEPVDDMQHDDMDKPMEDEPMDDVHPHEHKAAIEAHDAGDEDHATSVPVNMAASSFEFEGFAPGKSHAGTFEDMEGTLFFEHGVLVAAEGTIQAVSVKTDSEGLDKHLRNEDFFHVEMYPTIEVMTTEISEDSVTADITFHGVTQRLTFPADVSAEGISADTVISMEDFGISYTGVNDEVRITFSFVQ